MEVDAQKIIDIVRSTRNLTFPNFGNVSDKGYKSDSTVDVVTQIDQDTEEFLKVGLNKIYPGISFVGEEFSGDRTSKKFWLVDPIDGTGDFVRGIPFCTTMLALIDNGRVVFSIIYDFVNDVIYHAELGKGAFKNGEKIAVSNRQLNKSYLSFEIKDKKKENEEIISCIKKKSNIVHLLCAGYEYVLVATGKIDGRIVYDGYGYDFDFAAGSLLVSEAGGIVKNFHSDTYNYTNLNFVACNKNIYEELVKVKGGLESLIKNI